MSRSSLFQILIGMVLVVCLGQVCLGAEGNIFVAPPVVYSEPDFIPGQIIVQFRPGTPAAVIAQLNQNNRAQIVYTSQFARFRVLSFPDTIPPQAMANIYARNPNVEYAELNYVAHAFEFPGDPPNDPLYNPYQWHLSSINVEKAWSISNGATVTVAVVDTGVKLGGSDGVPASGGYDYVNNDSNPDDDNGHGTHVAGTIAQHTNNGTGVAGVAYGCSILPVKVLNRRGSGTYAQIAEGIYYAANEGAKVINMSLGGGSTSTTLENAVAYAYGEGVTIVCAAGNESSSTVSYPAAYDAYCIAVGATRYDETLAPYSNYGSSLDLCAPGGDTSVDQNGDGYGDGVLQETYYNRSWGYWFFQGTSMAAPHVSGVAALLISQGTYTSPLEVKTRLESTAKDKGTPGWDSTYGWGIVDAFEALGATEPTLVSIAVTPANVTIQVEGTQQYAATGTYSDYSTQDISSSVTWSSSDDTVASISSSGLATGETAGSVSITAAASDVHGSTTLTVEPSSSVTLVSIAITPADATIQVEGTQQYAATGTYSDYSTQDISSSVTWSSSDDTVASISSSGLAAGLTAGIVDITATFDGVTSDPAWLTVTNPPTTGVLRVESINGWCQQRPAGKNIFISAVADIVIFEGTNAPVEGATVTADWSDDVSGTATGVTDMNGRVVLTSPEVKIRTATVPLRFVITITDVQKTAYTYDDNDGESSLAIDWP